MCEIAFTRHRATVSVVLLLLALSGCSVATLPIPPDPGDPAETMEVATPSFGDAPKEAVEALKLAGFEHAIVYSWKRGRLGGFIQFDGASRIGIDVMVDRLMTDIDRIAKGEGVRLDPSRTSGLVVFAVSPLRPSAKVRECFIGLPVAGETSNGKSFGSVTLRNSGTIPDLREIVSGTGKCSVNLLDGPRQEVFDFFLVRPEPSQK
jgi:hypothetical protein